MAKRRNDQSILSEFQIHRMVRRKHRSALTNSERLQTAWDSKCSSPFSLLTSLKIKRNFWETSQFENVDGLNLCHKVSYIVFLKQTNCDLPQYIETWDNRSWRRCFSYGKLDFSNTLIAYKFRTTLHIFNFFSFHLNSSIMNVEPVTLNKTW